MEDVRLKLKALQALAEAEKRPPVWFTIDWSEGGEIPKPAPAKLINSYPNGIQKHRSNTKGAGTI